MSSAARGSARGALPAHAQMRPDEAYRRGQPRRPASTNSCRDSGRRRGRVRPVRRSHVPQTKSLRGAAQRQRRSSPRKNGGSERDTPAHVGNHACDCIARAHFDPNLLRAHRKPEHDQRVGSFAFEQRRQFPIHCLVAHGENVSDATDIGEGRMAPARQLEDQRPGRIIRCAGERPEAGDEDFRSHWSQIIRVGGGKGNREAIAGAAIATVRPRARCPTPPRSRRPLLPATCAPRRRQPRGGEAWL